MGCANWQSSNSRPPPYQDSIDSDSKDRNNRTPLSWAAENGHNGIVKLLLARDAVDPDSKDDDGGTPLSWAAENGCESVVKLLLATGRVDPNSKDTNGETPFSWARINGHEEVIKILEPYVDNIRNLGAKGREEMTQVCSFQSTRRAHSYFRTDSGQHEV